MTGQRIAETSTPTAAELADFAAAAYWPEADLLPWLTSEGWRRELWIAKSETECFLARHTDRRCAVLAFRGTELASIRDWVTDLNTRQADWIHGRVHAGFLDSVDNVFPELWPAVSELHQRDVPLFITGHSKGAAEATITAARLRAAQIPVAGLCTFGSPRVGDAPFAAWMEAVLPFAIQRYVHNNDAVTRVPLPAKWISRCVPFGWLLPVGFRHCGRLRYITAGGTILNDPPLSRLCLDRLTGRWLAGRNWWNDGLRDHAMWRYQEALSC